MEWCDCGQLSKLLLIPTPLTYVASQRATQAVRHEPLLEETDWSDFLGMNNSNQILELVHELVLVFNGN